MNIILDDTKVKESLYPFTATRNAADIRVGILTIREKWAFFPAIKIYSPGDTIPDTVIENTDTITFDAGIIPTREWMGNLTSPNDLQLEDNTGTKLLKYPWDIFQYNDWAIRKDFEMIASAKQSQPISSTNKVIGGENIFLEEGAIMEHSIINAATGPVYIGKNAQVLEGCMIRGPFALCEGAVLKMGSKVYGATTIGPFCNVGGEIKNSVLFGYSNKSHDGYLGDSVIGEWCNLGAGTSNSNVKNTAAEVKVWSKADYDFLPVGIKCGLLMGDYSRAAINTSFNTGTVVGVCCNIFDSHFPPRWIPHFTWGKQRYTFTKVLQDILNWKNLKGMELTDQEISMLTNLYNQS